MDRSADNEPRARKQITAQPDEANQGRIDGKMELGRPF
jgi:hypothetical protein